MKLRSQGDAAAAHCPTFSKQPHGRTNLRDSLGFIRGRRSRYRRARLCERNRVKVVVVPWVFGVVVGVPKNVVVARASGTKVFVPWFVVVRSCASVVFATERTFLAFLQRAPSALRIISRYRQAMARALTNIAVRVATFIVKPYRALTIAAVIVGPAIRSVCACQPVGVCVERFTLQHRRHFGIVFAPRYRRGSKVFDNLLGGSRRQRMVNVAEPSFQVVA